MCVLTFDNSITYYNNFSYGTPASHNTKDGPTLIINLRSCREGCFCQEDPCSFPSFIMDEVRNCGRVLVKFVSSVFDLEIWLASAGLLRDASFCCPPQHVAAFAMNVFAGSPGLPCDPGLAGSIISCFLKTLYAHINVGTCGEREYTQ